MKSRSVRTLTWLAGVATLTVMGLVVAFFVAMNLGHVDAAASVEDDTRQASGQVRSGDIGLPIPSTKADFFLPGTQPHTLIDPIPAPTSCQVCHSVPEYGNAIYGAYRGSMMAQAGRDPVFWAAFAVASSDANGAGEFCLRCHMPKGWYEGRSEPPDASAMLPADIDSGVACEVCHRMVDPVPGAQDETTALDITIRSNLTSTVPAGYVGSGMLIIDPRDNRRGPFDVTAPHTALQSNFQNQGVDAIAASRLCGSCHNVDNPLLSWNENPPGGGPAQYWPNELGAAAPSVNNGDIFPLERTYNEWLASAYATDGVYAPQFAGAMEDGVVRSCQDCHMERQTGQAALAFLQPQMRDCVTNGCLPAHIFVGGNAWVPQLLQDARWRLTNPADANVLQVTADAALTMLGKAARVTASLQTTGSGKQAVVRVINQTGHKLPTGYPEGRRMWVNLQAFDADDNLIFESAAYNWDTGILTHGPEAKVYEVKQGLTPELAAWLGKDPGQTFHFALNNVTVKDNRIPPRGYTVAGFDQPGMRPVGATFVDGQYWDDTVYNVPAETTRVVARLYYQTSSSEYIEFLAENGGVDGQTLATMWQDSKSPPVLVTLSSWPSVYVPVLNQNN